MARRCFASIILIFLQMAITIRQSTNTALQYNNAGLSEYLIADNLTGKKFLTNAPTRRTLRRNELSVIDFLINDSSFVGGLLKEYKDKDGNVLYQTTINLSNSNIDVHNSINIDWSDVNIPDGVVSQCIKITNAPELFVNSDFSQGTGDAFTGWTLTQPSDGFIIQSATGGLFGSRCLMMFASNGSINISQNANLTNATEYKLSFWARVDDIFSNAYVTGPTDVSLITSTEWTYYEQVFNWIGTGTFPIALDYSNDNNDGFVYLDNVRLTINNIQNLTETRCFTLDANCYEHENQIQWINKLGGKDTFVFTGLPILEKSIERQNLIKYPQESNYSAPNAIYQNRTISSKELMTIFTRCENEETARWLRDEINDCIAIYLLVGNEYYPIIPEVASVQVYNENGFNYNVNMKFRFAFDVNIQTI